MKQIFIFLFCIMALCANAQTPVAKTIHKKALKTDVVTTGTMTVRKPDYICIATDGGKDLLIMDGTRFTMTMGGKKHTTDSRKNEQFATFHSVLKAVLCGDPIPQNNEVAVSANSSEKVIVITPKGKKRQLFTSFVLVIDAKTSAFHTLRMNGRNESYTEYKFK